MILSKDGGEDNSSPPTKKRLLDYGSGHNPRTNWCTSDPWLYGVDFKIHRGRIDCPDKYFYMVRASNVIHHVKDLDLLARELSRITDRVVLIDINEDHYQANVFLDQLWYRFITNREEIWFSEEYRDPRPYFSRYLSLVSERTSHEKELLLWRNG